MEKSDRSVWSVSPKTQTLNQSFSKFERENSLNTLEICCILETLTKAVTTSKKLRMGCTNIFSRMGYESCIRNTIVKSFQLNDR